MVRIMISGTEGNMDNYIRAVNAAGGMGVARYSPMESHLDYDGLLLCGGGDLSPQLLKASTLVTDRAIDPVREASDLRQIADYSSAGKPILGICRGMQVLNTVLGGSLIRDLGVLNSVHSGQDHWVCGSGGVMERLYGKRFKVNSAHHQAVKTPAPGFRVTLHSDDGIIEAIEHMCLPIIGLQWHPERQENGIKLFEWFWNKQRRAGVKPALQSFQLVPRLPRPQSLSAVSGQLCCSDQDGHTYPVGDPGCG